MIEPEKLNLVLSGDHDKPSEVVVDVEGLDLLVVRLKAVERSFEPAGVPDAHCLIGVVQGHQDVMILRRTPIEENSTSCAKACHVHDLPRLLLTPDVPEEQLVEGYGRQL